MLDEQCTLHLLTDQSCRDHSTHITRPVIGVLCTRLYQPCECLHFLVSRAVYKHAVITGLGGSRVHSHPIPFEPDKCVSVVSLVDSVRCSSADPRVSS